MRTNSFLWAVVFILGFVIGLIFGIASSAHAQQEPANCGLYLSMVMQLDLKYQEKVIGRGLVNGRVFEMFASERGSWTVLIVRSDGVACHWASGTDWEVISSIIGDKV